VNARPNFALPVRIENCETPTLLAIFKRCDLHGLKEEEARNRLASYLTPAAKPVGPVPFPGATASPRGGPVSSAPVPFPGVATLSNIPIRIPEHFLGRDEAVAEIDAALKAKQGRVAITTLHGLRGVGKTTLAAAYAELRRADYRAAWWIRAQTESTMRADLVALGVRLGWVAADAKEEPALDSLREKLRGEGEGLLLIYDNAIDAESLEPYLPLGGAARVLITSNSPDWRRVAAPVEIRVWPKETGADYLIARAGREKERAEAEALSLALGGLPLAHEQASAFCARLRGSFADYRRRFDAEPGKLLDDERHAPSEYGRTVAKTFAIAIDEAAKLHPAAEDLIVRCALLAPEPIPLFVLREGREKFGEPLASQLGGDGLDEALAALRAFALIDDEMIADEREPMIETDAIRLHRLVRAVASGRCAGEAREAAWQAWIAVFAQVYSRHVYNNPSAWRRARRLDALAMDLVGGEASPPDGAERAASLLLNQLAVYRQMLLADYAGARLLFDRSLSLYERTLGPEHPHTATSLNNLAGLLDAQGNYAAARPLFERVLAIREKALGAEHPDTGASLNNLAGLLRAQGDYAGAKPLFERALAISEKALGAEHLHTGTSLNNLALLLHAQGDYAGAKPLYEQALAICVKALGAQHPDTGLSLNNLAGLLYEQGDYAGAKPLFERALEIREKALGAEHPDTSLSRANLAVLLLAQGAPARALELASAALSAHEKLLGVAHPWTQTSARVTADALDALGRGEEAAGVRARFGVGNG
jgi:tetratricopeptide (TPR) repeat protein